MTSRNDTASHAMWQLEGRHRMAPTVLHFLVSKMPCGTNSVVISAATLAKQLGLSSRTIQATIAVLRESQFVQVLKSGNTNVYIINSRIAWEGDRGSRYASLNAHITVHEQEQDRTVEELIDEAGHMLEVPSLPLN